MELLESGQSDNKNEVNGAEMRLQNSASSKLTENVAEEKNEMKDLNESFFARIEKYLDLKKQYFCCCSINIWMLTIAAITVFTAIKTQILLLITDDLTVNVVNFILIFPVWISGILAIFAYTFKIPLLIWPFIVYLIIINLLIIACLVYFALNIIPAKINGNIVKLYEQRKKA
uniref:Uncharacterized protein n=1 Tax=Wuchereria bancrofti TaxID=6293 RepID=A0A1I8ER18_WUCBA